MKRDMDLIRRIVLETEKLEPGKQLTELDGVEEAAFIQHVMWLVEAGLIKAIVDLQSGSFASYAFVDRLTWNGCEFAAAIQSDTLWAKAKANVIKPGISWSFEVLKHWLVTEIEQGLPTISKLAK